MAKLVMLSAETIRENGIMEYVFNFHEYREGVGAVTAIWDTDTPGAPAPAGTLAFSVDGQELASITLSAETRYVELPTNLGVVTVTASGLPTGGAVHLYFRPIAGEGEGPGPGPDPDPTPWEGMNPITKVVILSDSIMNTGIGSSDISSMTMNADGITGSFIGAATWQAGNMCDVRGANSPVVNQPLSITASGSAGSEIQFKLTQDIGTQTGEITKLNTETGMGMKGSYGFTQPSNWWLLGCAISGKWPLLVHHAGQGSATCAILLSRMQTEVIPHAPSHVIIHAGTNNIANSGGLTNDQIIEAIQNMCSLATGAGIQAIVASIPPANASYGATHATRRREINIALQDWIETQEDVFFVDTYSLMVDEDTGFAKDGYLIDGVHPSTFGYWESRAPWVDMMTQHAVAYGSDVPNRIPNADFSTVVPSNNAIITGQMPSGCTILISASGTSNTVSTTGIASVADGIWDIDLVITNQDPDLNETLYLYVNAAESVTEQTQDKQELVSCDFSAVSPVNLDNLRLTNNYQLNSITSITVANSYAYLSYLPSFGEQWFTLTSRPVYIKAGDTYGAYRAFAYIVLPKCPVDEEFINVKFRVKNPALLTIM